MCNWFSKITHFEKVDRCIIIFYYFFPNLNLFHFHFRNLYGIFSHGYSSQQLLVPVDFILRLTAHANNFDLFDDCKYYNIRVTDDKKHLNFQKLNFKNDVAILKCKHEHYVDMKLKNIYLPEVLLMKKI